MGWDYVSGDWENKDSEMTVRCPNGTEITGIYRSLRDNKCTCEKCKPMLTAFISAKLLDIPQIASPTKAEYYTKIAIESYNKLIIRANFLESTLLTTFEEYVEGCKNVNRSISAKISIICFKGHSYTVTVNSFMKYECSACSGAGGTGTKENFILKLLEKGWVYISGEYVNRDSVLECKCAHPICKKKLIKSYKYFSSTTCKH